MSTQTPRIIERDQHHSSSFLSISTRQILSGVLTLIATLCITKPFDSSHLIISDKDSAGLRWDAIHFGSIAIDGYQYEQQLAFMPLVPLYLRLSGEAGALVRLILSKVFSPKLPMTLLWRDVATVTGGPISTGMAYLTAVMLYKLTRSLTGSHRFAGVVCAVFAFLPHPPAAVAPYTEPLYTALTFTGFYYSTRGKWLYASGLLALATATRAMGVFNIGVLGWHILFGNELPSKRHFDILRLGRRSLVAIPCCLTVLAPFIAVQVYAYTSFCLDPTTHRPWCDAKIPLVYSFVQAEYWNIGLLNYWSLAQLPNFLLAAPVLLVSMFPTITYFRSLSTDPNSPLPAHKASLLPFQIHHTFMTLLLIFGSHTQIALRLAMTNPVIWWNVASMAFDWSRWYGPNSQAEKLLASGEKGGPEVETKVVRGVVQPRARMTVAGKLWIVWVVTWGAVSLALWAGYYPPA